MPKRIFCIEFTRTNFKFGGDEKVSVVLETKTPFNDDFIDKFVKEAWDALWVQYPIWACPFHQGNPPRKAYDKVRHSFCSPSMGRVREVA